MPPHDSTGLWHAWDRQSTILSVVTGMWHLCDMHPVSACGSMRIGHVVVLEYGIFRAGGPVPPHYDTWTGHVWKHRHSASEL